MQATLAISQEIPVAGTTASWHWHIVVDAEAEDEIPQFEMSGFSETKKDAEAAARVAAKQWYQQKLARENPVEVTTVDLDTL